MIQPKSLSTHVHLIKPGLALVLLGLIFGIAMGVAFGINEDGFKNFISQGIAAHPQLHDQSSAAKIWRYAQRAHFHATGIAAFSLGLLLLVLVSTLKPLYKKASAILIGLSSFYPLAWFTIFLLSPGMGRDAAHEHILVELFVYIGIGGLLAGMAILIGNLFLGMFGQQDGGEA